MNAISGIKDFLEKRAQAAPHAAIGKTLWHGAKASVPWSLGFHALEQVTKPPHVSYETPGQKAKDLGINLASGAAAFGAWDVAHPRLKSMLPMKKLAPLPEGASSKRVSFRAMRHLRRLPKASVPFLGSLLVSGLAATGVEKLLGKKNPDAVQES